MISRAQLALIRVRANREETRVLLIDEVDATSLQTRRTEVHRHDSGGETCEVSAGFFYIPEISVVFPLGERNGADDNCPVYILL